MTAFKLTTPLTLGSLGSQVTVNSLQVTGLTFTSTPDLAPLGTGKLSVTLTEPSSGWQEEIVYSDTSVLALWNAAQSPRANTALGDIVSTAILTKLIADGKLPAGTISTS